MALRCPRSMQVTIVPGRVPAAVRPNAVPAPMPVHRNEVATLKSHQGGAAHDLFPLAKRVHLRCDPPSQHIRGCFLRTEYCNASPAASKPQTMTGSMATVQPKSGGGIIQGPPKTGSGGSCPRGHLQAVVIAAIARIPNNANGGG